MDENQEQPKSYILAIFSEVGSAMVDIQFMNVTPGQMLAVASMLEVKGKNAFVQQENRRMEEEQKKSLAVPSPSILTAQR